MAFVIEFCRKTQCNGVEIKSPFLLYVFFFNFFVQFVEVKKFKQIKYLYYLRGCIQTIVFNHDTLKMY